MHERPTELPTLGLPFSRGLRAPNAPIHGANVAVSEALEMIIRHSRFPRVRVFVGPRDSIDEVGHWLGRFRPITEPGTPGLSVESRLGYPHHPLGRLDAWHSVTGHGSYGRHLRGVASASFPVTAVHHSFAANHQLHDWVLRLLLDDVRPYDSQIATSRSNAQATRRSLEHVQHSLEAQLGCELPYRGRIDRIPLGVDTGVFRPRDKAEVRYELGIPPDEFVILWIGRLSASGKADLIPTLGSVAEVIRATRRPIRVILGGVDNDHYAPTLRTHARHLGIEDRLWLQSPVPPLQRHLWHAAADVFISPADSMQETFGLTCIEAMACGVPQLVSDWDGYRDTVVDGVTGYLVPTTWIDADRDLGMMAQLGDWSRDHFALAQSVVVDMAIFRDRLRDLVEDVDLRRRLGEASRARAVEHFDWAAVVGAYDDLWEELAARAASSPGGNSLDGRYLVSRYVHCFRDNATRLIEPSTRIVLSERGQRVIEGEEGLPEYFKGGVRLDYDAIEDALVSLDRQGKAIGTLAEQLTAQRPMHHDSAIRHVVWLLKYDLAQLADPPG